MGDWGIGGFSCGSLGNGLSSLPPVEKDIEKSRPPEKSGASHFQSSVSLQCKKEGASGFTLFICNPLSLRSQTIRKKEKVSGDWHMLSGRPFHALPTRRLQRLTLRYVGFFSPVSFKLSPTDTVGSTAQQTLTGNLYFECLQ